MNALITATAIVAVSGTTFGLGETIDRSNTPIFTMGMPGVEITRRDLEAPIPTGGPAIVYDGLPSGAGAIAAPATTGNLGAEDYGSILSPSGPPNGLPTTANDTMLITEYEFVGGVAQTSGLLFFDFFFNDQTTANSFGVFFPTPGNFIYSVTIANGIAVPTEGFHAINANNNPNFGPITSGSWFLSDVGANPIIGHNDDAIDNGTFDYGGTEGVRDVGFNFALTVPAPGAVGVLGLAGLGALRRRRA